MSYLEWKSYARSQMEFEDQLRLEDEDELRLEVADNGLELKSAAELLNSCRRAKARKASKTKHKSFLFTHFFYPVFTRA